MKLANKRALVTGAASGIGRAIAARFAREGAALFITDIDIQPLHRVAAELSAAGYKVHCGVGDVSSLDDAQRLINEALTFLAGLDILINNAGISLPGSVTTVNDGDWERVVQVNLNGVYRMSRFGIPAIAKSGGGAVVNLSSMCALIATPDYHAYGVTKAGVKQLTLSMAAEFAPNNIRVNCICPGPIDTPMIARGLQHSRPDDPQALRKEVESQILLKRMGRPEEIANCALFLASEESSYVTGHALVADGGFTAQ